MDNEGMQQLAKEEKIIKALGKVSEHVSNLQWESDRMSEDGRKEYRTLVKRFNKLVKLCK